MVLMVNLCYKQNLQNNFFRTVAIDDKKIFHHKSRSTYREEALIQI